MSNIIFVVGSPRSGTTYLSRALGLAEGTCYLGESALFCLSGARKDFGYYSEHMSPKDLFPYNAPTMRSLTLTDFIRNKDRIKDAAEHLLLMSKVREYDLEPSVTLYKAKGIQLNEEDRKELTSLTEQFKRKLFQGGMVEFAKSYLNEYASRKGCETVVEKTPIHLRFLPVIHEIFPEAKVVLIKRDKYHCLESYFKTFGRGLGVLRYLPTSVARKIIWKQLLDDEKREHWAVQQLWIKTIDFVDFVNCPIDQIRQVTGWLGLDFNFAKYSQYFPDYNTTKE
jgi:hypothetical protein